MASFKPGKQLIFMAVIVGTVYGLYVYASASSQSRAPDAAAPIVASTVADVAPVEVIDVESSDVPEEPAASVAGIVLSDNGNGSVSWVDEESSELGYKVVWGKSSGPTYPTRDSDMYVYYSDSATTTGKVTAFGGDGAYFVRVCEYLGSECGTYSNEISVILVAEKEETKPVEEKEPAALDVSSISASGSGSTVTWTVNGASSMGFKVVWGKSSGPTYPTRDSDRYQYYSDPAVRAATLDAFDGDGTYFVRVCEYLGGQCGVYSNEITLTLDDGKDDEPAESENVSSISLWGTGESVGWSVDGYSDLGFKVVWSKTSGPTYPTRDGDQYQYFSQPATTSATLSAFDGEGAYFVRVCEYLGGKCGVYSNQIEVNL